MKVRRADLAFSPATLNGRLMLLIDITEEGVSVPHRDPDHTLKRPIFDGKNAGEKSNRRDPRASQTS